MSGNIPSLPAAVLAFARFALNGGFEVQRELLDGSFNSFFRLASAAVTITIVQDRGQWHIDIGRNGMQVRCVDWRRRLGDALANGETLVDDESAFYRRNWDAILNIASDATTFATLPSHSSELSHERLEAIKAEVERLRRERQ
jgi:hypothetical protein